MTIAELLVPEIEREAATTRSYLALVPDNQSEFRPHPKSMALGQLAVHLATIPRLSEIALQGREYDIDPADRSGFKLPEFQSAAETVKLFDTNVQDAKRLIQETSDEKFAEAWSLKKRGSVIFTLPRAAAFRSFFPNHLIHHRAQLGVYLRLLNIPVPQAYGPTADSPV